MLNDIIDKRMVKTKCAYCEKDAIYQEPSEDTGQVIDVCYNHFRSKFGG